MPVHRHTAKVTVDVSGELITDTESEMRVAMAGNSGSPTATSRPYDHPYYPAPVSPEPAPSCSTGCGAFESRPPTQVCAVAALPQGSPTQRMPGDRGSYWISAAMTERRSRAALSRATSAGATV